MIKGWVLIKQPQIVSDKKKVVGVGIAKDPSKWRARIYLNGRDSSLGVFPTRNDAIITRLMAELKYLNKIVEYDY